MAQCGWDNNFQKVLAFSVGNPLRKSTFSGLHLLGCGEKIKKSLLYCGPSIFRPQWPIQTLYYNMVYPLKWVLLIPVRHIGCEMLYMALNHTVNKIYHFGCSISSWMTIRNNIVFMESFPREAPICSNWAH